MARFTFANAAANGSKGGAHRNKGKGQSPRNQVKQLQRVALADATNPETPVAVRAAIMRAYVDLQELRMSLEGIGRPKPVEARNATPKHKRRPTVQPVRVSVAPAITSFTFNYDSGAYTAQVQNNGGVNVWNDDRGLYDHFQIFGLGGFPPVAGQTHSGTYVSLTDTSALVFASTDLPRDLKADDFQLRSFHINWGIDWETRIVSLTVESIALVERRPEITAWAVSTNALILEITFPSQPYTNILQRSFQLGPSAQWDTVTAFVSSGGKTNWPVSLQTELPMRFYRMRPQ